VTDAGGDSSTTPPTDAGAEATTASDAGDAGDGGGGMTIAAARMSGVTTPVTVVGVVTAVHGLKGDQPIWYIEDPQGGPNSGIAVYCDPDYNTCSKSITAPALGTKVQITGTIAPYMGQVELSPTAQTVVAASAPMPPAAMVTMADLAPSANSMYRGVYVKLTTKLTVDNVTPPALYDTQCATAVADAGVDAGGDGGVTYCSGCSPATYSGFQANDGMGHEVYIEEYFFNSLPLQSSPECLTQPNAVPVSVNMTFSSMAGILDYDGYASAQDLMPVQASDYTTP
jgi:predicted extracellular nuclease